MTTKDSSPNCMMSSMIGWPVRTTSRMRLLGITSSTTLPMPSAAEARLRRAAYLSESQTTCASRSTMIAPSHIWSSPSNSDFRAILRIAVGSFRRLTFPPRVLPAAALGLFRAGKPLFHDGLVLAEEDFSLFIGADATLLRVDLLRPGVGRRGAGALAGGG